MKQSFIFSLIFFTLLSCSKKEVDKQSSCSANDWEYSYIASPLTEFFFQEGSYWILMNDLTNSVDSIRISHIETGCEAVYLYQGYGINWEYYKIFYKSYPSGYSYYDMIESDYIMRNRHPSKYPTVQGWILYSSADISHIPWHPILYDSLVVNNHTFYHVQMSQHPFQESDHVYMAKGIGIIRRDVLDSNGIQTWNLIRWKIYK